MRKQAYALFNKDRLVGCYFARAKAAHLVDEHLGDGLFSPEWDGDKKGDYEIVPCRVEYGKLYTIPRKDGKPRMFASVDELVDLLKSNGVKVKRKNLRSTTFDVETERGTVKGKIIQVK